MAAAGALGGITVSGFPMRSCQELLRAIGDLLTRSRFVKRSLITIGFLCPIVPATAVEYKIDAGDVIEIMVARVPELQRRVTVKSNGTISFPLLGTLSVVGLPSSEVEANIQAGLATKIFRQRTP